MVISLNDSGDRSAMANSDALGISRRESPTLSSESRHNIADSVIELNRLTVSDRFACVLALLNLEYDLPPDVLAEAENVLQGLRSMERTKH